MNEEGGDFFAFRRVTQGSSSLFCVMVIAKNGMGGVNKITSDWGGIIKNGMGEKREGTIH